MADLSRSIDELDDDLLLELNEVVRENQLAYLPFARSGRAEALLFEKYPELAEKIERGKRAKIDAIVLSNKFAEGDGVVSNSFRAQSLEELSVSPLRHRARRRASKESKMETESPVATPALKSKASVTDLIFEMSDGDSDGESKPKFRQPQFTKPSASTNDNTSRHMGSPEQGWTDSRRKSNFSPDESGIARSSDLPSPSPLSLRPAVEREPGRPWGSKPLAAAKFDLKDIMAQTPSDKPSNLSLGFSQQERDEKIAASFHAKPSQKERKRLQQAQLLGHTAEKPQPAPPAMSPWQATSHRKASPSPAIEPSPSPSRTPSTTQLTMRQTIANKKVGSNKKNEQQSGSPRAQRSISGNGSPSQPRPQSERGMSVSTTPIPTPHSVRHIPLPSHSPTSPSQHLSMEEILSLQQAEKVSIRDAAAKRSLQEIQQEQEFQQWWDQESKRVIQEEEQRKRADERAAKASRGRGKARGGRSNKPKGKDKKENTEGGAEQGKSNQDAGQVPTAKESSASSAHTKPDEGKRGRGKSRGGRGGGGGGGRGGGRSQAAARTQS